MRPKARKSRRLSRLYFFAWQKAARLRFLQTSTSLPTTINVVFAACAVLVVVGCTAMPDVSQDANEYCRREGKQAVEMDRETGGSAWTGRSTTLKVVCVSPERILPTDEQFGVDLVKNRDIRGASVLRVAPGSIGDGATLKAHDIIVEYAGQAIESAEALAAAVAETRGGERVTIKLHRGP